MSECNMSIVVAALNTQKTVQIERTELIDKTSISILVITRLGYYSVIAMHEIELMFDQKRYF